MKKIAIFGGTFDPITNAHLQIGRYIRDNYDMDVIFLPTKFTRWKDNISSSYHRLNMLKLALKDEERFSISEIEVNNELNETNYTIDTILELNEKYKDYELYYIIGSDQLDKLDKWKDIEALATLVKFLVIERKDYPINQENLELFNCIKTGLIMDDISSTGIRNYESKETKQSVLDYIYETGIYAQNLMKKLVDEERYEHCIRVAKLAKEIAKSNGVDEQKAYYAGLIHDCAKRLSHEKTVEYMLKYEPNNIKESFAIYHQYIADIIAKEYFFVKDKEILHSIKYHTTGVKDMNKLDKIIYCADKLELGRGYDSTNLINYCKEDIDYGFAFEFIKNIDYIKSKNPLTVNNESLDVYEECKKYITEFELKQIYKTIDDKLGLNITIYNTTSLNTLSNYTIIATATSERQLLAIIDDIEDLVYKFGFDFHHKENQYKSGWVLIDLCDIIVHVFKGDAREEYGLDDNLKTCAKIEIKETN